MKKIFLLVYVTFCSLIFYQIILGKNGVIEGYRVQKEKERNVLFFNLLKNQTKSYSEYINYLKTDPDALKLIAENLGFFSLDDVKLIRVIDESDDKNINLYDSNQFVNEEYLNNLKEKIFNNNEHDIKIHKIRTWLSVFFYIFFGFFIFLIIFGVKKSEE